MPRGNRSRNILWRTSRDHKQLRRLHHPGEFRESHAIDRSCSPEPPLKKKKLLSYAKQKSQNHDRPKTR